MNLSLGRMISIIGLGSVSTLMILLMVEVLMAQIIVNTILNNISDNLMIFIIIFTLFLLTILISIIVGYVITKDVRIKSVRNASLLGLGCLILFLFAISNITLYIYYSDIYDNIYGLDILWVFPQVLVNFSIYILNDVFNLFILTIVVYYIFFVFFLEKLHEIKIK